MSDEQKIKTICEENNVVIKSFFRIRQGFSNKVFDINDKFILRLNDEKSFLAEVKTLLYLQEHNVPVPKIIAYDKEHLLLEKIKGKTLEEITPTQELYEQIGRSLKKLHTLSKKGDDSFKQYVLKELNKALDANIPAYVKEFLKQTIPNLNQQQFIHCDPAKGNIIITPEQKICFIDFEWCEFGDPLYDLAVFEIKHDQKFHQAFKRGYGQECFDENIMLMYKVLHELNVLRWAQKRNREKIIEVQQQSLKKLFQEILKKKNS